MDRSESLCGRACRSAGAVDAGSTAISAPVPHHLFHGNLPGAGALVNDELYKVRIASHIVRVSEDKFKN